MTAARLFLGLAMVPYAIDKLLAYQFKVPAWSYSQPLGATSGSTLAWATFGYSPHLQMLLGLFELIPALLLLNVRTRRLGARPRQRLGSAVPRHGKTDDDPRF